MKTILAMLAVLVLAGCAATSPAFVDASHGAKAKLVSVSVDGSMFIGATPAALSMDGRPIATIGRGKSIVIKLPCGPHVYSVPSQGVAEGSGIPHNKKLDVCDEDSDGLRIGFKPFHGFYITEARE